MPYAAGFALDLLTAWGSNAPIVGTWVFDAEFPLLTASLAAGEPYLWYRQWWRYYYVDPTRDFNRRVCGITLPAASTDRAEALAAARRAGVSTSEADTAVAICNAIVSATGVPVEDN